MNHKKQVEIPWTNVQKHNIINKKHILNRLKFHVPTRPKNKTKTGLNPMDQRVQKNKTKTG